jgi:hypothetical protein
MKRLLFLVLALLAFPAVASEPQLSPSAPKDKPASVAPDHMDSFEAAIAPYIAQAKSTYPTARAKFLDSLPKGQYFFVTTRLYDNTGAFEQVFIAVNSIQDDIITGRIASDIGRVSGYRNGDPYTFPESDLLDWLITHPDGSEEGNFVGKFLDGYQGSGV